MRLGRRFFAAAGLSGMAFGVLAVAVPMHVAALHRPASVAGQLLASVTIAVALGALTAGPLGRLAGSARNVLALSMAVSAAGQLVLLSVTETAPMLAGTMLAGNLYSSNARIPAVTSPTINAVASTSRGRLIPRK